jgi:serine/threonine protein kinase
MSGGTKPIIKKYYSKIRKAAGLEDDYPSILDCGSYGCAYDCGGGKVVKITSDESEAVAAAKVKTLGKHKNVYNVYNVFKLGSGSWYAIVQEKLEEPNSDVEHVGNLIGPLIEMDELFEDLFFEYSGIAKFKRIFINFAREVYTDARDKNTKGYYDLFLETYDDQIIAEFIGEMFDLSIKYPTKRTVKDHTKFIVNELQDIQKTDKNFKIFDQIANGVSWLYRNGIEFIDVHSGNIMQRHNGDVVLIDLGISNTQGGGFKDIELIESYVKEIIRNGC